MRGSKWFVSHGPLADFSDVVDPISEDIFLYPQTRDMFQFNGVEWAYAGQLGAGQ